MFWKKNSIVLPDTEEEHQQIKSKNLFSKLNVISFISFFFVVILGVKYIQNSSSQEPEPELDGDFQWKELSPGSGILHANITLPLDYQNPTLGNVTVALAKLPATVEEEKKLGTIVLNPGGPGGSGTQFIYSKGQHISGVVDGRYDILGFDPRGVNWTTPEFSCISPEKRAKLNLPASPLLTYHNSDDVSYGEQFAEAHFDGLTCSSSESGQYISTALVATDMLHISEQVGNEKLNYWGFSYGTTLGNTFAHMFPDKVGRMIVDGVMDSVDYYEGYSLRGLDSTDGVSDGFFEGCALSDNCAINGTTSDEIRDKVLGLLDKLQLEPHVVFDGEDIGFITYSLFKNAFFYALYSPSSWPAFANVTNELLLGNGAPFLKAHSFFPGMGDMGDPGVNYATICGDSSNSSYRRGIRSVDAYKEHWTKLKERTSLWFEVWAPSCVGYQTKPVLVWDGPFEKINGSMLLIGNTYDPVTPLVAARKMSQFYTNGIVLHQDGYGHCSTSQKSSCTDSVVKKWFLEGILPTNNTICPVDDVLFQGKLSVEEALLSPMLF